MPRDPVHLKSIAVLPLLVGVLLFVAWGCLADGTNVDGGRLLSSELVAALSADCDAGQVYRRAWQEHGGGGTDGEREAKLRQEITPILLACLEKELAVVDCSAMNCQDVDSDLRPLIELLSEYFVADVLACYTGSGIESAVAMYAAKLEQCYTTMLAGCDCNLAGLQALWAAVTLDDNKNYGLDGDAWQALVDRIVAKYEECLIGRIQEMTNVFEMMRLVFEEEAGAEAAHSKLRWDTLYNNSTVAWEILKRLIQLYELEIDINDPYMTSRCCDPVRLLRWLYEMIDSYGLQDYPTRDPRTWTTSDSDNLYNFWQRMELIGDLYTVCRELALQELTADCTPSAFCTLLSCRECGVEGLRDALEDELADPREQAFLASFKERLEECSGCSVDLDCVVGWCVQTQKTWEALRALCPISAEIRDCAARLGTASGTDYKKSGYRRYDVPSSQRVGFFEDEIDAYADCPELGSCARALKAWFATATAELRQELAGVFWDAFQAANR